MLQTVRITSKRQITIPAKIFRRLKLQEGDALTLDTDGERVIMRKAQAFLDELAGSVSLPEKYRGMSLDTVIAKAKEEYFRERYQP